MALASTPAELRKVLFLKSLGLKLAAYVRLHCRKAFVPQAANWFFAGHTPTTRKVTCTEYGAKDWCAEVSVTKLKEGAAR